MSPCVLSVCEYGDTRLSDDGPRTCLLIRLQLSASGVHALPVCRLHVAINRTLKCVIDLVHSSKRFRPTLTATSPLESKGKVMFYRLSEQKWFSFRSD